MLLYWWKGKISLKAVWKYVKMDSGRRYVTEGGMLKKHRSCADNWDLLKIQEVSYTILQDLLDSGTEYPCIINLVAI